MIHRDLEPANIMLGDFGEAHVLDWGLARAADRSDAIVSAPLVTAIVALHVSMLATIGVALGQSWQLAQLVRPSGSTS